MQCFDSQGFFTSVHDPDFPPSSLKNIIIRIDQWSMILGKMLVKVDQSPQWWALTFWRGDLEIRVLIMLIIDVEISCTEEKLFEITQNDWNK